MVKNSGPDKKEKCSISDIYFGLFVALGQSKSDIASTIYCCKVVKTLEWLKKQLYRCGISIEWFTDLEGRIRIKGKSGKMNRDTN